MRWVRLATWLVPILVLSAAPALAGSEIIRVEVHLDSYAILGTIDSTWAQCALVLQLSPAAFEAADGQVPFFDLKGGAVTATRFWRDDQVVRDPASGVILYRLEGSVREEKLAFEPTRVSLLAPNGEPDLRMAFDSTGGLITVRSGELRGSARVPSLPSDPLAAQNTGLAIHPRYSTPPEPSGWATSVPESIDAAGTVWVRLDGVVLSLSDGSTGRTISTGLSTSMSHGVHETQTYSYVEIKARGVHVGMSEDFGTLAGRTQLTGLSWNGEAVLHVLDGSVALLDSVTTLAREELRLDGQFGTAFMGATTEVVTGSYLKAEGRGTVSSANLLSLREGQAAWSPRGFSLAAAFVMGAAVVGGGAAGLRRIRQPRTLPVDPQAPAPVPPQAKPPERPQDLPGLVQHVRTHPLDSEAHFQLAVEFAQHGSLERALPHLERSFRLSPDGILRLLEDPQYESLRDRVEVRRMLGRVQREYHRRLWSGYA